MKRTETLTYEQLQNLSKEELQTYDEHLRQLRQQAREQRDLNEVAFLSRTIEWTTRMLKYKK